MTLFVSRLRLNRLLSTVELILVLALLGVAADIALTLQALNHTAERQQHRALLASDAGEQLLPADVSPHGRNPARLPVAPSLDSSMAPGSPAGLAPQPEASAAKRARRLQIPAIGVDSLIYEGWDEEALRLGVGQRPDSPAPGEAGNLLLSAHNDIHGAIFRGLDRLERGDAIYISTGNMLYTYVVRDVLVVNPDSIWVTLPTAQATATLISCYPYLIDTHRIVVFADFAG
jgi:sortase A